jgi:uncharacterized protein
MPHRFKGERTLMRIFIGERDRCTAGAYKGMQLHEALVRLFRERGLAGCTVLRGINGFGATGKARSMDFRRLMYDLPLVVEVIETEEAIQRVLPDLDAIIGAGLITLERARVILYRPADVPDSERWRHRIENLEPEEEGPATQ